jgi:hypothetical protein
LLSNDKIRIKTKNNDAIRVEDLDASVTNSRIKKSSPADIIIQMNNSM